MGGIASLMHKTNVHPLWERSTIGMKGGCLDELFGILVDNHNKLFCSNTPLALSLRIFKTIVSGSRVK